MFDNQQTNYYNFVEKQKIIQLPFINLLCLQAEKESIKEFLLWIIIVF